LEVGSELRNDYRKTVRHPINPETGKRIQLLGRKFKQLQRSGKWDWVQQDFRFMKKTLPSSPGSYGGTVGGTPGSSERTSQTVDGVTYFLEETPQPENAPQVTVETPNSPVNTQGNNKNTQGNNKNTPGNNKNTRGKDNNTRGNNKNSPVFSAPQRPNTPGPFFSAPERNNNFFSSLRKKVGGRNDDDDDYRPRSSRNSSNNSSVARQMEEIKRRINSKNTPNRERSALQEQMRRLSEKQSKSEKNIANLKSEKKTAQAGRTNNVPTPSQGKPKVPATNVPAANQPPSQGKPKVPATNVPAANQPPSQGKPNVPATNVPAANQPPTRAEFNKLKSNMTELVRKYEKNLPASADKVRNELKKTMEEMKTATNSEFEAMKGKYDKLQANYEKMKQTIEEHRFTLIRISKDLRAHKATDGAFKSELKNFQNKTNHSLDELKNYVDLLINKIKSINDTVIKDLYDQLTKIKRDISELQRGSDQSPAGEGNTQHAESFRKLAQILGKLQRETQRSPNNKEALHDSLKKLYAVMKIIETKEGGGLSEENIARKFGMWAEVVMGRNAKAARANHATQTHTPPRAETDNSRPTTSTATGTQTTPPNTPPNTPSVALIRDWLKWARVVAESNVMVSLPEAVVRHDIVALEHATEMSRQITQ